MTIPKVRPGSPIVSKVPIRNKWDRHSPYRNDHQVAEYEKTDSQMEAISRHRANLSDFFESLGVMMVLRSFEPGNLPVDKVASSRGKG